MARADLRPRVLVVMPAQWPRALIRAALREAGYDAVGASSLATALGIRVEESARGPVRVVIVDQPALSERGAEARLNALLARHDEPATMLLAQPTREKSKRKWSRVLTRPVSVAEIVAAVEALLPLPTTERHAID